jgi:hypothetical protein
MSTATSTSTVVVCICVQRKGMITTQVIAYGIWLLLSKNIYHRSPGKMVLLNGLHFVLLQLRYSGSYGFVIYYLICYPLFLSGSNPVS